jgi:hypothetical protein
VTPRFADGTARTFNSAQDVSAQAAADTPPVAPAAPIGKIYELGYGITPPKFLRQDPAKEPCNAFGNGKPKAGTAMLRLVVNEAGEVFEVKVEDASTKEMATCAIQSTQRTHFVPGLRKNTPVAVRMNLKVDFTPK